MAALQTELDTLYGAVFGSVTGEADDLESAMDEATFRAMGRDSPARLKKMLEEAALDKASWWANLAGSRHSHLPVTEIALAVVEVEDVVNVVKRRP